MLLSSGLLAKASLRHWQRSCALSGEMRSAPYLTGIPVLRRVCLRSIRGNLSTEVRFAHRRHILQHPLVRFVVRPVQPHDVPIFVTPQQ
jgi:hypothetical protein